MTDQRIQDREARFEELQQQWHGWGSPVGLGIWMIAFAGFLTLLAVAWAMIS
jgi:hypothetical protein